MTQIPVLHLMNVVGDSSIGRIVQRLVAHLGGQQYSWHIGGVRGLWGNTHSPRTRLAAAMDVYVQPSVNDGFAPCVSKEFTDTLWSIRL